MRISYKNILKEAWRIAIGNKFLWLFGFLASFVALENIYQLLLSQLIQAQNPLDFYQQVLNLYQNQNLLIDKILESFSLAKFDPLGLLVLCLAIAAIMLFIWLAMTSQILVIKSASLLYHHKKVKTKEVFNTSSDKFWPVLGVNILIKLVLYAGFIACSLPVLYSILAENSALLSYSNILFFTLYIIFSIMIGFWSAYAVNFVALQNLHALSALKASWKLFRKNIAISLEIALMFFLLKLASIILIFCLFALFLLPLGLMFVLAIIYNDALGVILILTILILAFTAICIFVKAIFTTFYLAGWTITFTKLAENTLFGKALGLVHGLAGFFKKIAKQRKINKKTSKK